MKFRESSSYKGLLILFNCLDEMLDLSGQRKKLIKNSKEKILEAHEKAKEFLPVEVINDKLKISNRKISQLKVDGKCHYSISKRCLKLHPLQLSLSEQTQIKKYLSDPRYETWYTNHIWAEAQRNGLYVAKETFYNYTRNLYGKRKPLIEISESPTKSVRADKPFQIIHMDSTEFRCKNYERVYVHFIMDNFSRAILGAVASHSSKSIVVAENLKKVISKYNLNNKSLQLYCDDGPENQRFVSDFLSSGNVKIEKIVANYKTKKSNNMIEAWNKKFKQVILRKFKPYSFDHLQELLPEMIDYINKLKLPIHKTLSANEMLDGIKFESLDLKTKMAKARQIRLKQNQLIKCEVASTPENPSSKCAGVA